MFKKCLTIAMICMAGGLAVAAELAYVAPGKVGKVPYQAGLEKGGAVNVKLGTNQYVIDSMFSLVPGWAELKSSAASGFKSITVTKDSLDAANASFSLNRKLIFHDECVEVVDTVKNLTDENLPVIIRHQVTLGKVKQYRLCGYPKYGRRGVGSDTLNCSAICIPNDKQSIGMLALNDVFRAHFQAYATKGIYGIADNNLIIKPKTEQVMRWAVFPSGQGDYYTQINAMRRFLGVNYIYEGGFAFFAPYPRGVKTFAEGIDRIGKDHSDKEISDFIAFRGAKYSVSGPLNSLNENWHGSAWVNKHNAEAHRDFYDKIRKLQPGTQCMHYYHCFIDQKHGMKEDFPGCEMLTPSGKQADYRNPDLPLFLPVIGNKWAEIQEKRLKMLFDDYKVDGVFWDEFASSAGSYHYGKPWDGVSGDIDARTHKIKGLKSSVVLLCLPWRLKMVKFIASQKKFLIVNGGGAHTESMLKELCKNKYIGFVETGSITTLYSSHLGYPIGLGDHLTERNELDCYRNMVKYLDYGSLYFWYHQQVKPATHKTLTSYMFPITPVELHEGYIIGKERILTNRSGWYSFGGNEQAEAHFFDKNGYEVERKLESQTKDGRTFYKVVLAENESCALVKK